MSIEKTGNNTPGGKKDVALDITCSCPSAVTEPSFSMYFASCRMSLPRLLVRQMIVFYVEVAASAYRIR